MNHRKNDLTYYLALSFEFIYKIFVRIRKKTLSTTNIRLFKKCGDNLRFSPENSYFTYNKIEIGNNVFINKHAYFSGMIKICNDIMFGPYVFITDGYHRIDEIGKLIREQGGADKVLTIIENDCWIGTRTSILRGVRIGEGSVIGAMSVVTKEIPPYTICVGNPCIPIKKRYNDSELIEHLKMLNYNEKKIDEIINRRKHLLQLSSNDVT